jgi:hypothetical protein
MVDDAPEMPPGVCWVARGADTSKPLPCPFCGSDGLWYVRDGDNHGWVQCSICQARGPVATPYALAQFWWDRRRNPDQP